jgi:hypothetical protein
MIQSCRSYEHTVGFGLWDLFVRRKNCAWHDCELMIGVVWFDALEGANEKRRESSLVTLT